MRNWISLIYLIACAGIVSLLSMPPASHEGSIQFVVLAASLSYPFFLVWLRPRNAFWKGALQLLLILCIALICAFITYLLWYAYSEYKQLGSDFHFLQAVSWTFGESLAFFLYLDVMPAAIVAGLFYPVGYLASFQIFRLIRSYAKSEGPSKAAIASESKRESS
jgi:peptidoglycan biosynthesis protein MviN/MurJ (putative lipid II flippase)